MNRVLLLLLIAGTLALGLAIYRSRASRNPGIEPHAAEEIRKAQRR